MTAVDVLRRHPVSAAGWGLMVAVMLMALAMLVPAVTGWYVHVHSFPPLHAEWDPRTGVGTVPALVIGALAASRAVDIAERVPWRRLLSLVFAVGLLWMLALAFVDGQAGVGTILATPYEYLRTARSIDDLDGLHAALMEYVGRIRQSSPDYWPVHIAGHPPGALVFFVALVHLGLGGGFLAGMMVTVFAASTAVAVLVTVRVLGAELLARRAAPFVTVGPAAVWQCVSADAMFAAVAAWGIACLALAATRRSLGWSVLAGLLLGYCVMLSYGLPLLGLLAVAVLVAARSWFPLGVAVLAALSVVAVFWVAGFPYLEALPAIHDRYWDAVGGRRPASYWLWADLGALAFSAGPLAGSGIAALIASGGRLLRDPFSRVLVWLSGAGVAMVVAADLSMMSKAEVERIWLPFVPWVLLACALLPERWRRRGLVLQIGVALVVQHLLFTGW